MSDFHLEQARRNHEVFLLVKEHGYEDWAMTCLFYVALHCVTAWLGQRGVVAGTHQQRQRALRRLQVPEKVFTAYQALEENSRITRYEDWRLLFDRDLLEASYSTDYALVATYFGAPAELRPAGE